MDLEKLLDPAVLVFVVGGSIAIVAIIGGCVTAYAKDRGERQLKQTMLEQGKSVEEIERVILAGKKTEKKAPDGKADTRGRT